MITLKFAIGKEQERALEMRERVDALNKEQQTLANYHSTSVKKLKQHQLKEKHLTDYNELQQTNEEHY